MKKLLTILLFATGISLAVAQDSAPYFLSYQGRVTDGAGLAIGNSIPENRLVRFQIYSSATGGTPVYGEQQTATISGGEFSVLIGNGQAISGVSGPSNNTALATILATDTTITTVTATALNTVTAKATPTANTAATATLSLPPPLCCRHRQAATTTKLPPPPPPPSYRHRHRRQAAA
jgi:hypothetical protein